MKKYLVCATIWLFIPIYCFAGFGGHKAKNLTQISSIVNTTVIKITQNEFGLFKCSATINTPTNEVLVTWGDTWTWKKVDKNDTNVLIELEEVK